MWHRLRWHAKALAVAVVRLLLHSWVLAHRSSSSGKSSSSSSSGVKSGGPVIRLPRSALSQIHDLLAVVSLALATADEGEGAAPVHAAGLALLGDVLAAYLGVPDPAVPNQPVLQQYQAQVL